MITCITTFSKDGYDLYGHRMIDSWLKFWPENFKLIVYTEEFNIVETDHRLTTIDLNSVCPKLLEFKDRSFGMLMGLTDKKKINKIKKTVKWSHKVYAMDHALRTINDDYLIFLDGDTYTVKKLKNDIPEILVKNNLFAVHFENLKDGLHFETGLIVFNLQHTQINLLKELLTSGYDSLEIYDMKKTWDGFWMAHLYEKYDLEVADLSLEGAGVFGNANIKNILIHNVGTEKYLKAGYNKFTGRKQ
jgi:hypothetical protein